MQCGGQVVSMAEQVGNFKSLVRAWASKKPKRKHRAAAVADLISNSLVFISVGSNDLFEYSDLLADPNHDPNVTRNDAAFLQGLVHLYAAYVKVYMHTCIYILSICKKKKEMHGSLTWHACMIDHHFLNDL